MDTRGPGGPMNPEAPGFARVIVRRAASRLSQAPASAGTLPDFTAAQRVAWSLSV
jgi:hypothetical protein